MMQRKLLRKVLTAGGLAFCVLPLPSPIAAVVSQPIPRLYAQRFPDRMRRPLMPPGMRSPGPPGPTAPTAPVAPQAQPVAPEQPAAIAPAPAQASSGLPPSLLNQPAQAADVHFGTATLTIHADNSSLTEILKSISAKSGMTFRGLASDERVFGSFGPGAPREVLASLLNGTPYNIMMVGDLSDGAPRQLILSPAHSSGDSSPGAAPPPPPPADPNADDGSGSDDSANPDQPQTPQELYQQLQKMREQHPPQ